MFAQLEWAFRLGPPKITPQQSRPFSLIDVGPNPSRPLPPSGYFQALVEIEHQLQTPPSQLPPNHHSTTTRASAGLNGRHAIAAFRLSRWAHVPLSDDHSSPSRKEPGLGLECEVEEREWKNKGERK